MLCKVFNYKILQRQLCSFVICLFVPFVASGTIDEKEGTAKQPPVTGWTDDYHHFYGIVWRGRPADNLKYARQMGYEYVFYQPGMENEPESRGMRFFLESPELNLIPVPAEINLQSLPPLSQQSFYESMCCWRSIKPFPNNLVTGWPRNDHQHTVCFDFQQQRVIDYFVNLALAKAREVEQQGQDFRFAGFAWDEANLHGEFWSLPYSRMDKRSGNPLSALISALEIIVNPGRWITISQEAVGDLTYDPKIGPSFHRIVPFFSPKAAFHVPISYWTGNDSCLVHSGITHEYPTYTDGFAAYFKTLMARVRTEINSEAHWILEPYSLYNHWVGVIERRPDRQALVPDILSQEGLGTDFVDDPRIFASKLLQKSQVCSTSPDTGDEQANRIIAARAAINGAWFNWFGRFGGTGDMPNYQNIWEVPARLQLIRVLPNWDNLTGVALADRAWDGDIYRSPNSYASPEVIYSRHPKTRKMFAVFLKKNGQIRLYPGEQVIEIRRTNGFFIEVEDGWEDVKISGRKIQCTSRTQLGNGYIITIAPATSVPSE